MRKPGKKTCLIAATAALVLGTAAYFAGPILADLGGFGTPVGAIALDSGLVGRWKLDGSSKDGSPYADNGTAAGIVAAADRKGKTAGAVTFDGSTTQIDLGNPNQLKITGSQTISMWLRPTDFSVRRNPYAKAYGGEGTITQETNGNLSYYYGTAGGNGAPYTTLSSCSNLPLNNWTHVSVVRDLGAAMKVTFFINGAQCGQITAPYAAATASSLNAFIGTGYTNKYQGQIDDVRIYNRALSAAEAKALFQQYDPAVMADAGDNGLVGQWKMDGNAKDSSPNANNGNINGATPAADRKGRTNSAYSFDGSSNYIMVAYNSILKPTAAITVSAWIKPTDITSTAEQKMVSTTEVGGYAFYTTGSSADVCTTNQLCFIIRSGGAYQYVQTNKSVLSSGTWAHVAATFDGNTINLYVNGAIVGTTSYTGTISEVTTPFCIGSEAGPAACNVGNYFGGAIDDVRIYSKALTQPQIAAQYASYDSQIAPGNLQTGLVGAWALNGNAKDATPYGNNGTITAATLANDRKGRANSAYSFNGTTANITVGNPTNLQLTSDMTICSWVNLTNNSNYQGIISKFNGTPGEFEIGVDFRTGGSSLAWRSTNYIGGTLDSSFFTGYAGQWIHMCVVVSGTNATPYRNGAATAGATAVGTRPASTSNVVTIGNRSGSAYFTQGSMDDVRIWNRALSPAEVKQVYGEYR